MSSLGIISVWYGAILRGDVNKLTVGDQSSIGDRAVVHVAKIQGDFATSIGSQVSIGAGAIIHAATIQDRVVIGESAQVLDGAVVESESIVEPGAIVTPGTTVKGGELWSGSPAKKVRSLTEEEKASITEKAIETLTLASQHAIENAKDYKQVLEDELVADIEEYMDPTMPQPQGVYRVSFCYYVCWILVALLLFFPPTDDPFFFLSFIDQDPADVQGMGHPGRIFRSKLSHPEDLYPKGYKPKSEKEATQ